MPRLIWAPAFGRDLAEINAFLAQHDARAAVRTLTAIRKSVDWLTSYPRIGRAIDETYRVFLVRGTPYLVVYRVRDDEVELLRIRHARENWVSDPEVF